MLRECESLLICNSYLSDRECKQLSCERIDDHALGDLNTAIERFEKRLSVSPYEFRTKLDF